MTFFTPLLSILLVLIFASLSIISIRKALTVELNQCVKHVTSIQTEHRKLTNRLLNLNPVATKLRIARKAAEIAYRAAPLQFKAVARAKLYAVKRSQKTFHTRQLLLLKKAQFLSLKHNTKMLSLNFIPKKISKGLHVKKVQLRSDSPSYQLKFGYKRKKQIEYIKRIDSFKYLPISLRKFLKIKPEFKTYICGSTLITKRRRPWKTKLIMDRL